MTEERTTPLRERMIEDMRIRGLVSIPEQYSPNVPFESSPVCAVTDRSSGARPGGSVTCHHRYCFRWSEGGFR